MGKFLVSTISALFALGVLPAFAAPPHPDLAREIREGRRPVPEYLRGLWEKGPPRLRGDRQVGGILRELQRRQIQGSGIPSLPAPGAEAFVGTAGVTPLAPPVLGSVKTLALLASFADVPPWQGPEYFDALVFGFDGSAFGALAPSLSQYYREVSGDRLSVVTEDLPSVVRCTPAVGPCTVDTPPGWLPLPQAKAVYRADLRAMLLDAVAAADDDVDFARYDNDGDGRVDYLLVVHTGSGGERTGDNRDLWSQTVTVEPVVTADGVTIDTFTTVPEYWVATDAGRMTIGVYVHEFGHLLGLPDLYDYGLDSKGIGDWDLMALGMWNGVGNQGGSPSWPSAWGRVALGWVVPEVPQVDVAGVRLAPVEQAGAGRGGPVYYLWNNGVDSSEFFLIENRQKLSGSYDAYLPGHGLLVWHVDESMPDNNTQIPTGDPVLKHQDCAWAGHYRVALQQADGFMNLEGDVNDGDVGDPYPGSYGISAFSPTSTGDFPPRTPPNSGSYRNCTSGVAVRNITESGDDILLDFEVSSPPEIAVDGLLALSPVVPLQELPVTVTLSNQGAEATGVTAFLVSRDPLVNVTQPFATYATIPGTAAATNAENPFLLTLEPIVLSGRTVAMELHVTADGGYRVVLPFQMTRDSLRWGPVRPGSSRRDGGL
jgi:immune inhibitor A